MPRDVVFRLFSLVFDLPLHVSSIQTFGTGQSKVRLITRVELEAWLSVTVRITEFNILKAEVCLSWVNYNQRKEINEM